jgi:hypothetical protein
MVHEKLAQQVCRVMNRIREIDFLKKPGIAETLDWTEALVKLHRTVIDHDIIDETLGCIFKYREDMDIFRQKFDGQQIADLGILN